MDPHTVYAYAAKAKFATTFKEKAVWTAKVRDLLAGDGTAWWKDGAVRDGDENSDGLMEKFEQWLAASCESAAEAVTFGRIEALECNGVVCRKNLAQGERAFVVPRNVMITVEDVEEGNVEELKQAVQMEGLLKKTPMVTLALNLLLESGKGEESKFAPYIRILPRTFPGLPMLWSSEQLSLLQDTQAGDTALDTLLNWVAAYTTLSVNYADLLTTLSFSFNEFLWAMCVVSTRQNPLPRKSNPDIMSLALIPVFDMCNHEDGEFSTGFNPDKDQLECCAKRNFQSGEEFRIFYGPRDNTQLLVHCGFVPPPGTNASNKVMEKVSLDKEDPYYKVKAMILVSAGIPDRKTSLELTATEVSNPQLVYFSRVAVANKEELATIMQQQQACTTIPKPVVRISDENESRSLQHISSLRAKAMEWRLKRCESLQGENETNLPAKLCLALLKSEVLSLEEVAQTCLPGK